MGDVGEVPVTTVARTLLDLAACVSPRQLERAFHEAEVRRLSDEVPLPMLLERHPTRPGAPAIRALLASRRSAGITRSELEERFVALLDGRASHDTARGFERDRERDRALLAAGWRTIRVTWNQLREEPAAVVADLGRLLVMPARSTL